MHLEPDSITSWHAHIYFDAASRDAAIAFRDAVGARFGDRVSIGRFHERPVGPHPQWSCQIAFAPAGFSEVVGWLALNHGALDVFLHPNTGDQLRDHRDSAVWIGRSHRLDLRALTG
jgi:DOPA 4,5-dioxygenase